MLQVIIGKAGTGKTARMMQEIAARVEGGVRSILIVPEQYSHQAERELCALCGNTVSLYAEVLTFTGFARRIDRELGSGEPVTLDKGASCCVWHWHWKWYTAVCGCTEVPAAARLCKASCWRLSRNAKLPA